MAGILAQRDLKKRRRRAYNTGFQARSGYSAKEENFKDGSGARTLAKGKWKGAMRKGS